MIRTALVLGGVAVALYYLTGGSRSPVAEGRSWRLVAGATDKNWSKVYPDAVNRWVADRAIVAVKIESKEPPPARVGVAVRVEGKNGPRSMRGRFVVSGPFELPRPWGPRLDAPVTFDLEDVIGIIKDWTESDA